MNNIILPPRLQKGQYIALVAPADPVKGMCAESDIERGKQYLQKKGYKVLEGGSIRTTTTGHTAGTAQDIANEIHEFIRRDDVGCIMAFWGGLNTNRILSVLDYDLIRKHPKVFVGFSDITALTTAITTKTGLVTFSGPSFISFAKPDPFEYTWKFFEKLCILAEDDVVVTPAREYADDHYFLRKDNNHRILKENTGMHVFREGSVEGRVVAGNLQTLLALNGTEYFDGVADKLLFIEEAEETSPSLFDRLLCQCEQLGWFHEVRGVVIGRFTEQTGFRPDDSLKALLVEHFSAVEFPVFYDVDFGHTDPLITIPHGGQAYIDSVRKIISFSQAVI